MLANGTLLQERYRIIRLLARGGMGAVYEAEAVHLGNAPVAVKQTFYNEQQRTLREQFEREAATMARLRHPALPRVSDHFVEGGGKRGGADHTNDGALLPCREMGIEPE